MVRYSLDNRGKLTTYFSSHDVSKVTSVVAYTILFIFSCSIFVASSFEFFEWIFNFLKIDFDGHRGWVGLILILVWIPIFVAMKKYLIAFCAIVLGIGATLFLGTIFYSFFNMMSVNIRLCEFSPEFHLKNIPEKTKFLVFTLENRSDNKKHFQRLIEYKGQKIVACGELKDSSAQGFDWASERKDWRWEIKALDAGQNQLGLAYK